MPFLNLSYLMGGIRLVSKPLWALLITVCQGIIADGTGLTV